MRTPSWPTVGLAAVVCLAFTGIYYISDLSGRAALIPVVVGIGSAFTTITLARRIGDMKQEQIATRVEMEATRIELEKVKEHVNGNTSRLLDKIPDADRPALEDVPQL